MSHAVFFRKSIQGQGSTIPKQMIPNFPEFKKLEWSDKEMVEQLTEPFLPYSDFNFVSMWTWNTRERMKISQHYGNLILLFYDYITEKPFLSFIGNKEVKKTAQVLTAYSQQHYCESALRLVPEEVACLLSQGEFNVLSDDSAHDYILSVSYLSNLDTIPGTNNIAASSCRKFMKRYPDHIVKVCAMNNVCREEYISLFKRWAKVKNLDHWELNEYSAFEKFIENKDNGNQIVSMHDNGKMIAFATIEIQRKEYAVCHFMKADLQYKYAQDGLFFSVGKVLREKGIPYLNFEQDLGLPGLRQSKRKYKPEFYLKKFIVEQKAASI